MDFFKRGSVSSGPQFNTRINKYNVLQEAVNALGAHAPVSAPAKVDDEAITFVWNGDQPLALVHEKTFHDLEEAYHAIMRERKSLQAAAPHPPAPRRPMVAWPAQH